MQQESDPSFVDGGRHCKKCMTNNGLRELAMQHIASVSCAVTAVLLRHVAQHGGLAGDSVAFARRSDLQGNP
jgi:hypothetical protein